MVLSNFKPLLLIAPLLLAGCTNANVTLNGMNKLLSLNATPAAPGYQVVAGQGQLVNGGFTTKAKLVGFGSNNVVNGSFVVHGEIAR